MLTINEIKAAELKAQITRITAEIKTQRTIVKQTERAFSDACFKYSELEFKTTRPKYNECQTHEKIETMFADDLTIDEQILALRSGYKLESMDDYVVFSKTTTVTETESQRDARIQSTAKILDELGYSVSVCKATHDQEMKKLKLLESLLKERQQELREYYKTTFGVK